MSRLTRLAATAAIGLAAVPAAASASTPKPGYAQFKGCPNVPGIALCQTATITGGYFKLGKKTVPITSPITLTGGVTDAEVAKLKYEAGGGLKAKPIAVPGGLTGLTGLPARILNLLTFGSNTVTATPELVGDPTVTGDGIILPLRIKLKNNVLSPNCAIGSASKPVVLNLTTATTTPPKGYKPLTGSPGDDAIFDENTAILSTKNVKYVDNTFAVPGATGCGDFFGLHVAPINSLVNSTVGIPSAPGVSEAVQTGITIQAALDLTKVFG